METKKNRFKQKPSKIKKKGWRLYLFFGLLCKASYDAVLFLLFSAYFFIKPMCYHRFDNYSSFETFHVDSRWA